MTSRVDPRPLDRDQVWLVVAVAIAVVAGCSASRYQHDELARMDRAAERLRPAPRDDRAVALDGSLDRYVAYAMQNNPSLEASFEAWRAEIYGLASDRRLPEPTISYGLYIRRVETRVGPQRHRLGVSQWVPWPGKLDAAAGAAASRARAAAVRFDARALDVRRRVADAYWRLWYIDETRRVHHEQLVHLEQLADLVRARMGTGHASLADIGQLDLTVSRLSNDVAEHRAHIRIAQAALREAIGMRDELSTPIKAAVPVAAVPASDRAALRAWVLAHPRVAWHGAMAEASDSDRRRARAKAMPDFAVGLDYIETGPATAPDVADSGKDPVQVSVSLRVPLWRDSYADEAREATARAASHRANARAAELRAVHALDRAASQLRDSARRIEVHETRLIPQAHTVYQAVIGAYQSGSSDLADAMRAHTALLDLHRALVRARADHAMDWIALEHLVGRELPRAPL